MVPVRPLAVACLSLLAFAMPIGIGPSPSPATGQSGAPSRVSFVAAPGSSVLVHGTYPKIDSPCVHTVQPILHSRFPGTVEIGRDTDGSLFVIGVLPFEQYLEGIAEVPRTWPMAALEAQVVAARSYALANLAYPDATGDRLGYDLCATTACQVYAGMRVGAGPYGDRWRRAVRATAGEVLLYKGRPADTLYFSTSNGSTVGNDTVFGTDPLPYLRPVKENDDGASPLSHWKASLPFSDVGRFLRAAGDWGSESVSSVSLSGASVVVKGGGRTETLSVTDFRSALNYWAPCLDPGRYPGVDTDGSQLPQAIPSKWFSTTKVGGSVVLTGRGWGHGVGMVQWGAYGKAVRGLSYSDILAAYYGGLRPKHYDEPSVIRIGIATGLKTVTVQPTGDVTVVGADAGAGPWLLTGDQRLKVRHGGRAPTYISRGSIVEAPDHAKVGRTIDVTTSVPQLSVARLVFAAPGPDVTVGDGETVEPGVVSVSGEVPDVPPGTYKLQVELTNGTDIIRSRARNVVVTGGTVPSPSPSTSATAAPPTSPSSSPAPVALAPTGSTGTGVIVAAAAAGVVLASLGALLLIRRRAARRYRHARSWPS